jgi:hypothetical protein
MALQHDTLERRASVRASVRNHLKRTGYFFEFYPKEYLGLISGRIRRWIKKTFDCLALCNARRIVSVNKMSSCMVWMMIAS